MEPHNEALIDGTQLAVTGRWLRTARLRHEWFEFLSNPDELVARLGRQRPIADVFTFLEEINESQSVRRHHREPAYASVLIFESHDTWWNSLDFKVRNKVRKARKLGVEIALKQLDPDFVAAIKQIYDESPLRQGRPFWHYRKTLEQIFVDLSSFPECTRFLGAYFNGELIGFMKLFQGDGIIRTVHIIAKLSHRDKPVQDLLIAKAVELCEEAGIRRLHYGDWSDGGLGAFKVKHGFQRYEVHRYLVPLSLRGRLAVWLGIHKGIRRWLPEKAVAELLRARAWWHGRRVRAMIDASAG